MKLNIYYSLALLVFLSCTPDGKKEKVDLSEKVGHKVPVKKKIDLFNITFKETLKDAGLNSRGDDRQPAETLEGYGTYVSSSPDILIFDHQSLYGKNATDQNQLIMHYSLNKKVISAIELHFYTSDALKKVDSVLINKYGQPIFVGSYSKHQGIVMDKNGTRDGPRADITYQVWKNTKDGISYHLLRNTGSHVLRFAELTVINDKGSDADSWIKFKNYDKYPKKVN